MRNWRTTSKIASVPPVEAPIATTISFLTLDKLPTGKDSARLSFPTFTVEAILILVPNSLRKKPSIFDGSTVLGLQTKSTAPASIASNTLASKALITTTGSGY